jgi:hypothetical protein
MEHPMDLPENNEDGFPPVPLALVERLEELFPDRLPDIDEPLDAVEIAKRVGRADIIRLLRDQHEEQHKPPEE